MLEIDRSEWLATQFLKETMGSPTGRPRQMADKRPCTERSPTLQKAGSEAKSATPSNRSHLIRYCFYSY